MKNTKKLCGKGGFNLHKFVSNHKAVTDAIPQDDCSKVLQNLDITNDVLPVKHALGVQWSVESDSLQFSVELKGHSQLYDRADLDTSFSSTSRNPLQSSQCFPKFSIVY